MAGIYHFMGFTPDNRRIFVGADRKEIEERRENFLSASELYSAGPIISHDGIEIFDLGLCKQ